MVETTKNFAIGPEVEARKVEVGKVVAVPDVKEEMGRTLKVAILEQLGKWKLEEIPVEGDCSFDVT
jgi:hypothetical protein